MSTTSTYEGNTRIVFEGRLDTVRCMEIASEVHDAVTNADQCIEFDLAAVDFVSSSFLRLCVLAHKKAGSGQFQVVNVNPTIKRVFKIAGLDVVVGDD